MDQLRTAASEIEARGLLPVRTWKTDTIDSGLVVSVKELRMTEIPNECVGFVGPEDTSKWNMVLDFPRAQLRSGVKAVVEAYSVQL